MTSRTGRKVSIDGSRRILRMSWYLTAFTFPWMKCSCPVPARPMHPQTMRLAACFTLRSRQSGWKASSFVRMIRLRVSPGLTWNVDSSLKMTVDQILLLHFSRSMAHCNFLRFCEDDNSGFSFACGNTTIEEMCHGKVYNCAY